MWILAYHSGRIGAAKVAKHAIAQLAKKEINATFVFLFHHRPNRYSHNTGIMKE